jgi:hypothetical protein
MAITTIVKTDAKRQLVFGWASVAVNKDGSPLVDRQGDIISMDDLEDAAYVFVLKFREANQRHQNGVDGVLVESLAVTPEKLEKMGLAPNALPAGWWVGFYIEDPAVFAKVESGEYAMFSIEGSATREPVTMEGGAV